MKIVEFIHSLCPGGAERFVTDLSNELSKENEVYLLTLTTSPHNKQNFYKAELSDRVKLIDMGYNGKTKILYLYKVYKEIKRLQPDVVHVHCLLNFILFAVFFYRKCKYVQTLHNKAEIGIPKYLRKIAKYLFSHNIIHLVTISKSNKESYENFFNLHNDTLIYNGRVLPIKTSRFEEVTTEIQGYKKYPDDIVLLCVARCNPQKNLNVLIQSVNELTAEGYHLQLLIIGPGYDDTILGKAWKEMSGENVRFLGTRNNVADYYMQSDAFCLSSLFEGMPITLIEAMACKCIPVSTPVSGIVDIINDGENGFVASDFSIENYKLLIRRFLKERNQISGDNLYRTFESRFSIQKCAHDYNSLFVKLIK